MRVAGFAKLAHRLPAVADAGAHLIDNHSLANTPSLDGRTQRIDSAAKFVTQDLGLSFECDRTPLGVQVVVRKPLEYMKVRPADADSIYSQPNFVSAGNGLWNFPGFQTAGAAKDQGSHELASYNQTTRHCNR